MAFPSRTRTPGKQDIISQAKLEADSVKSAFVSMIEVMQTNPISVTNLTKLGGAVAAIRSRMTPIVELGAEIDEYAQTEYGRPITGDAQDLIDKAEAVLVEVKRLVPATEEGWLLVCKFDADGTLAWRRYLPEELTGLIYYMQELINVID